MEFTSIRSMQKLNFLQNLGKEIGLKNSKSQVQETEKSFSDDGHYVDNSLNRKLGRVGQPYPKGEGRKKKERGEKNEEENRIKFNKKNNNKLTVSSPGGLKCNVSLSMYKNKEKKKAVSLINKYVSKVDSMIDSAFSKIKNPKLGKALSKIYKNNLMLESEGGMYSESFEKIYDELEEKFGDKAEKYGNLIDKIDEKLAGKIESLTDKANDKMENLKKVDEEENFAEQDWKGENEEKKESKNEEKSLNKNKNLLNIEGDLLDELHIFSDKNKAKSIIKNGAKKISNEINSYLKDIGSSQRLEKGDLGLYFHMPWDMSKVDESDALDQGYSNNFLDNIEEESGSMNQIGKILANGQNEIIKKLKQIPISEKWLKDSQAENFLITRMKRKGFKIEK